MSATRKSVARVSMHYGIKSHAHVCDRLVPRLTQTIKLSSSTFATFAARAEVVFLQREGEASRVENSTKLD